MTVAVAPFVNWMVGKKGTKYKNDEHRCDVNSPTHDCSGLPCTSMRANGEPSYPCLDSYGIAARIRTSGKACSIAVARATYGYVLTRGGVSRALNPHGHVAISLGDGRTIEAYDTADGVIIGHVDGREWNDCGPFQDVDYSQPGLPPGPSNPGEARDMGMSAAKILPGSHAQTKDPWEGRYPFIGFVKQKNLTTDAVGFDGAVITNDANHLNPHGATSAFGMSIFHLGVLTADVEDVDEADGALVGLAGDGGTFAIHATPHYL